MEKQLIIFTLYILRFAQNDNIFCHSE